MTYHHGHEDSKACHWLATQIWLKIWQQQRVHKCDDENDHNDMAMTYHSSFFYSKCMTHDMALAHKKSEHKPPQQNTKSGEKNNLHDHMYDAQSRRHWKQQSIYFKQHRLSIFWKNHAAANKTKKQGNASQNTLRLNSSLKILTEIANERSVLIFSIHAFTHCFVPLSAHQRPTIVYICTHRCPNAQLRVHHWELVRFTLSFFVSKGDVIWCYLLIGC